jgi:hypothetical protein
MSAAAEPLSDATLSLFFFPTTGAAAEIWTRVVRADGSYSFENLPAGRFRLVAEKSGYSLDFVSPGNPARGREFDLDGVIHASGMDLVMRRTGVISGRVTRPDGSPVFNAHVDSTRRREDGRLFGVRSVTTDADGRYRMTNVPAGSYLMVARHSFPAEILAEPPAGESATPRSMDYVPTFYRGVAQSEAGTKVAVAEGAAIEGIDFTLLTEQVHAISGIVRDERGSPIQAFGIEYSIPDGGMGTRRVQNAEGRFVIDRLHSGSYTLLATADTGTGLALGMGVVELHHTSATDIEIVVGKPGTVRGHVVVEGELLPPGIVPRITLESTDIPLSQFDHEYRTAVVSQDGRFEVTNVIGTHRVQVQPLPVDWTVKAVRRGGQSLREVSVVVNSGEIVEGIEVVIGPK